MKPYVLHFLNNLIESLIHHRYKFKTHMKLRQLTYILLMIVLFGFSCTPYKNVPYFQDVQKDSVTTEAINNFKPITIQPGDLLAVHVSSPNHTADAIFNYNLERPDGANGTSSQIDGGALGGIPAETIVYGYLVDGDGNIKMPYLGSVHVAGMTTSEISSDLQNRMSTLLTSPIVDIRLLNFKISVLGDVKSPGTYTVQNEKITVVEALSLAGDLNTTGIRNVLLVREVNGKREYIPLDLKSKKLFESPYFYLKNNDMIYVQPNKERVADGGTTFQKASLALAVLSIIVYLVRN
jgi:polysaccharide biosynthesis/export protein